MQGFDFWQLFFRFRFPLLILLSGLVLILFGTFVYKSGMFGDQTKIEVLESVTQSQEKEITAEVAGAVLRPGVYKMPLGSRTEDLLILSGGFSGDADRVWSDKYLNRAAKLTDGQKLYIPSVSDHSNTLSAKTSDGDQTISSGIQSDSNALVNINTASLNQLDSLPGIGQVYGQNIIEHRPYSNIEELVSKGAIKQSLFDKIKNLISVY